MIYASTSLVSVIREPIQTHMGFYIRISFSHEKSMKCSVKVKKVWAIQQCNLFGFGFLKEIRHHHSNEGHGELLTC